MMAALCTPGRRMLARPLTSAPACLSHARRRSTSGGAVTGVGVEASFRSALQGGGTAGKASTTSGSEGAPLVVIAPAPGGPADKAGIRPGDEIVAIDGQPTSALSLYAIGACRLSARAAACAAGCAAPAWGAPRCSRRLTALAARRRLRPAPRHAQATCCRARRARRSRWRCGPAAPALPRTCAWCGSPSTSTRWTLRSAAAAVRGFVYKFTSGFTSMSTSVFRVPPCSARPPLRCGRSAVPPRTDPPCRPAGAQRSPRLKAGLHPHRLLQQADCGEGPGRAAVAQPAGAILD